MSMSRPGGSSISLSGEETKAYTLQPIPPQPFGKYTLIGNLGQGGMAEVLVAALSGKGGFQKLVVVKRLHAQLEAEPSFVEMFLDEARLAARLDHPHCVQTLDVGDVEGQHFLAMEYLDGQGLERLLRWSAQSQYLLPVPVVLRMIADAADGLSYAHHLADYGGRPLGVVHRDVSPQNLFVTYAGVVKVLDFGIAKAETNLVRTRAGVIKGKYAYIAPEQARGAEVDPRADIWSLGVVLWECLTSRRLFKSTNDLATLHETLHGEIRPPSEFNAAVPPEADAIVLRALSRDLDHRFQSANELKAAIESYLSKLSTPPGRDAIAALMSERFEEVQRTQREKLAHCLASLASSDAAGYSEPGASEPFGSARTVAFPASALSSLETSPARSSDRSLTGPSPRATAPASTVPPRENSEGSAWKIAVILLLVALIGLTSALIVVLERAPGSRSDEPEPSGVFEPSTAGGGALVEERGATHALAPRPPIETTHRSAGESLAGESLAGESLAGESLAGESLAGESLAGDSSRGSNSIESDSGYSLSGESAFRGAERSSGARAGSARRRRARGRSSAPPAEEGAAAAADSVEPEAVPGFLSLVTSPWTVVRWRGRTLGETPLVRVPLPAGRHELDLVNQEAGIHERYVVDIEAGQITSRRLGLR